MRIAPIDAVSHVSNNDEEQKPETCAVLPEGTPEPDKSHNERQRQPSRSKFAQEHSAKFNKLRSDHRGPEGEEHAILATGYVPPDFL